VTGVLAASTAAITPPSIEYSQLAPILVVFGAAVAGILVEAFTPRPLRRAVHLVLTLGSLIAAFVLTIVIAGSSSIFRNGSPGHVAAVGAVAVDRPTLFIQGTILVLAFVSVLLIADPSDSPFAAQAAAPPGSQEEREGLAAGMMHTEIFPLTLFAVGGMLLFPRGQRPAHHVRRTRGAVAAAVPAVRPGPPPPAAVARGSHEVFPARRLLLRVLPVRHRHALRVRGLGLAVGHRRRGGQQHRQRHLALRRDRAHRARAAVQDRGRPVPRLEARCVPGRTDPDHRADGVLHRGVGLRCAAARLLRRVRQPDLGLAPGAVGDRDPDHGGGRGHRHHPDRREAACWPTPPSRTPASC